MVIDLHAKNQVNIGKLLGKKSGKLSSLKFTKPKARNFAKN